MKKNCIKRSIPDIGKQYLELILKSLDKVHNIIFQDSFNLSRDDLEAIDVKIEELKAYIKNRYEQHSPKQ